MTKSKNQRVIYIDILNIISILAVIILHHNGIVHKYFNGNAWKTSLIAETVFYWAVPVFIMISGAMLMDYRKKYDTKTFFKKRVTKVLIPFLFWNIVMICWKLHRGVMTITGNPIKWILNVFFTNKAESTYYFGFVILGLYLTIPLLSHVTDEKHRKTLWYCVIIFFIFNSFLPPICNLFKITYTVYLKLQIGDYLIFIILGYLLSTQNIKKKNRIILYIAGAVSVIIRYVVTYWLSTKEGHINKVFFGYGQFHSILRACAVFIFIKNINWNNILKNGKIQIFLSKVSSCSFGIYLIHKIIMHYELRFFNINILSWEYRIIGAFVTYFICLGIIYVLKQIPLIKKIVA